MLSVLFFLFMLVWSVGGGIAALVLYEKKVLPVKDPFKQMVGSIICGPLSWIGLAIRKNFMAIEHWLREGEEL